jgi:enoyl-CoA hydratase/carnithine racemase
MNYETIILELKEGVGYLTLNRPDRANTISLQLMKDVVQAMERVEAEPEFRVVVVTGAGRHFCGGADLRDLAERTRRRTATGAEPQKDGDFVTPGARSVRRHRAVAGAGDRRNKRRCDGWWVRDRSGL